MVTLAEVAQHAGVSASTVSYVLSGKRSISANTRQRVERSIRELGYHPNAGARALASSRSNVIALMIPLRTDMYVPVMMEIAIAVATTARTHGYDVLLLTGEEGPDAVRRVAGSGLADGMILMDVELDDERLPLLRGGGPAARAESRVGDDQPAVLIGLPADTTGLTCVDLDFKATGALCVEHLAEHGHRDIAVIGEAPAVYERHTGFAERTLDGLRGRARELGLRLLHRPCEGGYDAMAVTLARILDERPGTTGFVVQNESAVEPLLALLRQQGRAVPEDVSVVAICPEQVAVQASVRLTSVAIPAQEMGRRAVEQLVAKFEGRGGDEVVLLAPELTVRASSGPAPGRP
ncbi:MULTISPECIES: LacI family DNA-binding transcriptional regulator [Streptomyces]|jgi:DNA-binding LacI/PurR family transcriptional regulator|uniref:DNA-binding LacI/PurR family transcriptional regulator n=2 Tax=Streptomyces TaxID=1883 RepID=A0A514JN35_9ACTN|nr:MULTISPECIES: LacI family DNA-binding transcriptional regulator [Streptomyces]MBA8944727.1 DNA-binding LacI/PurR family transcriptional regulator [Streptomyces calvus]MBA8975088.1 DNA-binding LacI/PurR family transcriptional regulator [Streptomyces calvus]MYS27834.1 substrate-binding domain-containing protein [Streptomyces sp. SID7804]QDI68741.1 LacI family transcriptional regulator [Streptomyces calvus]GGP67129.1 LacI family transcriptional regulator [Streptomyces calvus]